VAKTLELLRSISLLPFDLESCAEAGRIAAELRRQGESIDARDVMIAGITRRHNETLVTRNDRHFARIAGLKVEAW